MAQTGNDILKQILGVCVQINKKMDSKGDSGGSGALGGIFGKNKAKKAKEGTKILDAVFTSISNFVKMKKKSPEKIERTAKALDVLFKTLIEFGKHSKSAESAISILDKLGERLKTIQKAAKAMGMAMLSVGGAVVLLAAGIFAAGKIFGTDSAFKTMAAVILIVGVMAGAVYLLGKVGDQVDKGTKTAKGMGIAMLFLAGGVVALALGVAAVGKILSLSGGNTIIMGVIGVLGIIGVMAVAFSILGKFASNIIVGAATAAIMGIGMASLAWGVTKIAEASKKLTSMGDGGTAKNKKGEEKGKFGQMMANIGPGLGLIGIVLVSSALLFAALGIPVVAGLVALGAGTTILISVSLSQIAKAVANMLETAKVAEGKDVKKIVKNMVGGVIGGLVDGYTEALGGGKGIKGMIQTGKNVAALFTAMATLKRLSKGLSLFAKAVSAFAEIDNMRVIKGYKEDGDPIFGETVDIKNVSSNITDSITTFITALVGIEGLTKKKGKALKKMGRALTGRRGILRAVIDFADVIKTFASFGDGTAIPWAYTIQTGVDEDGNPITKTESGPPVSLTKVVDNIVTSFTNFVGGLTSRMEVFDISRREGKKMKRVGKILSGKNGLLSPISQFAETLKIFSQFGSEGKIAYSTFKTDPITGDILLDKSDNPIPDMKFVTLDEVVNNIISSFSTFMKKISSRAVTLSRREKKRMKRLSKALTGSAGIFGPINEFADVLQKYAAFGKKGELPVLDAEGKPTKQTVSMEEIAGNIFDAIKIFSTKSSRRASGTIKGLEKSNKKLKVFTSIVEQLNEMGKISTNLDSTSKAILGLAESMSKLSESMEGMDPDTLAGIAKLGKRRLPGLIARAGEGIADAATNLVPKIREAAEKRQERVEERKERREERREAKNEPEKSKEQQQQEKLLEQQQLADQIGAAITSSMNSLQFSFDFQGENKGILVLE